MANRKRTTGSEKGKGPGKRPRGKAGGVAVWCEHTGIQAIEAVVPNPDNPNRHPPEQIALLAKIIVGQGWRNPIVVSDRSGFITKGHGRLEAARHAGLSHVPVDVQHYDTEAAEWADVLADNRIAELAEMDPHAVDVVMNEHFPEDFDLDLTGYDEKAIEDLLKYITDDPPADPDNPRPVSFTAGGGETCAACGQKIKVKKNADK